MPYSQHWKKKKLLQVATSSKASQCQFVSYEAKKKCWNDLTLFFLSFLLSKSRDLIFFSFFIFSCCVRLNITFLFVLSTFHHLTFSFFLIFSFFLPVYCVFLVSILSFFLSHLRHTELSLVIFAFRNNLPFLSSIFKQTIFSLIFRMFFFSPSFTSCTSLLLFVFFINFTYFLSVNKHTNLFPFRFSQQSVPLLLFLLFFSFSSLNFAYLSSLLLFFWRLLTNYFTSLSSLPTISSFFSFLFFPLTILHPS